MSTLRYAEMPTLPTEYVMTSKKQPAPAPTPTQRPAESAESRLDEALEESFPASDPIAVDTTDPHHSPAKQSSSEGKKRS